MRAVAHTEGGAQGARPPPYGQDEKYHNLKAEVKSFPTVPST